MTRPHDKLQTIVRAYQQICAGEEPWIALGNFRSAWYGYAKDIREQLVCEPLMQPVEETEHTRKWAAFCAASVEFLCDRYSVACPAWTREARYRLTAPWWHTKHIYHIATRVQLMQTTPEPFARCNIFCGNRLFQNKYEMSEWVQEARARGLKSPGEIWQYARQKEISIHGG
ncbi:hypothetical protein EPA93_28745 [Ktedonosporobacter rubrisoli]|uniref:Uncharacterized protein n=1 Tax=Ktedonosporobacter rubrisoli TaxID=2509675 RepID=A0A4P6JWJ1_KTERU|nr:hypothetical protein [Ktedonosporobacter rubrisoli]QBD79752.1 hypothetical protein EPA93_28745 [Ktedonosporobacter rubrisoli]